MQPDSVCIDEVCLTTISSPGLDRLPAQIATVWNSLKHVETRTQLQANLSTIVHAHIMAMDLRMWEWLWDFCQPEIVEVFGRGRSALSPKCHWLHNLTWTVYDKLSSRQSFMLSSAAYIEGMEPTTFTYTSSGRPSYDPAVWITQAKEITIAIIKSWLHFPTAAVSEHQACFVQQVLCRFRQPAVLLLPIMWTTRSRLRAKLLKQPTELLDILWHSVAHSFSRHPLSDLHSPESQTLCAIRSKFTDLQVLAHQPVIDFISSPSQSGEVPLLDVFLKFLRDMAVLIDDSSQPSVLGPVQARTACNTDRYLPFREHARSRKIILEHPHSPYNRDRLCTRNGFFNALVFRGVTQAAPILLKDQLVHFTNAEDFYKIVKDLPEDYRCNNHALGIANKNRHSKYVQSSWDGSVQWENFLVSNSSRSFLELWKFICAPTSKTHIKFMGFGPLTAYLLAADCAYAGIVNFPTAADIGHVIYKIGRGGLAGLKILNLVPASTHTKENCAEAIGRIVSYLRAHLTKEEVESMPLDVITIEHSLCKLVRLDREVGVLS
jgi:hypothetical protein